MSYAVDRDFVVDVKEVPGPPLRIGLGFNLALFTFINLMGFLRFVTTSPTVTGGVPWAGLVLTTLLDLARVILVLAITAAFFKVFWERLVATVFPIRAIDHGEAFAVVMMLSLLFGS